MYKNQNKSEKIFRLNYIIPYSTLAIAITTILGLIFVILQLQESQKQTENLKQTLMQSYRPIGVISNFKDDGTFLKKLVLFYPLISKDKFSFVYNPVIMNKGKGILSLLGYISYLSKEEIKFRDKFLNGEIIDVVADSSVLNYTRGIPILPTGKADLSIIFNNVNYGRKYFLYILAFYEDQDHNLFDTEHLVVISFGVPEKTNEGFLTPKQVKLPVRIESYNTYTVIESRKLYNILEKIHNPIRFYVKGK